METALLIQTAAQIASGIAATQYAAGQLDPERIAEIARVSVQVAKAIEASAQGR
jgi:hypothetical protein